MKTLKEYLEALSVNNVIAFGLSRDNAEKFIIDLHNYGLLAFEKLPVTVQYEILNSYSWVFRPTT